MYIKYSKYPTCYLLRWYICLAWLALVEIAHFRETLFMWKNCRCYRDIRFIKISRCILQAFGQTAEDVERKWTTCKWTTHTVPPPLSCI